MNYHLNGLNAHVGKNELRVCLFCCAIEQFLTPVLFLTGHPYTEFIMADDSGEPRHENMKARRMRIEYGDKHVYSSSFSWLGGKRGAVVRGTGSRGTGYGVRGPGVRGPGVWKTRGVVNAGSGGKPGVWKMRGLVENAGNHFFRQNMNFPQ